MLPLALASLTLLAIALGAATLTARSRTRATAAAQAHRAAQTALAAARAEHERRERELQDRASDAIAKADAAARGISDAEESVRDAEERLAAATASVDQLRAEAVALEASRRGAAAAAERAERAAALVQAVRAASDGLIVVDAEGVVLDPGGLAGIDAGRPLGDQVAVVPPRGAARRSLLERLAGGSIDARIGSGPRARRVRLSAAPTTERDRWAVVVRDLKAEASSSERARRAELAAVAIRSSAHAAVAADRRRTAEQRAQFERACAEADARAEAARERALQAERELARVLDSVEEAFFSFELAPPAGAAPRLAVASGLERILGAPPPAELLQAGSWRPLVPTEDLPLYDDFVERAAADGAASTTLRLVGLDDRTRWVELEAQIEDGADGTRLLHGVARDATDWREREDDLERAIAARERALDEAEDAWQAFERAAGAIEEVVYSYELRPDGDVAQLYVSPGLERLLGGAPGTDTLSDSLWWARVHADDREAYHEFIRGIAGSDGVGEATVRIVGVDGVAADVTARHRAEEALHRYERIVASSSDMVIAIAPDGTIAYLNDAVRGLLGRRPDELIGAPAAAILHRDDAVLLLAQVAGAQVGDAGIASRARCLDADGEPRHFSWVGSVDAEDGCVYFVARDVTDAVRAHDEAELQSRTDALTGLPNRRVAAEAMAAQSVPEGDREAHGLLLIDVDHFKRINDTIGHGAGDAVLVELARRLRGAIGESGTIARWGGEEFLVLLPRLRSAEGVRRAAERVRQAVGSVPFPLGVQGELAVTVSIGAALRTAQLETANARVDAADRALYAAKRRGRDRVVLFRELGPGDLAAEDPETIRLAQALALAASVKEGAPEAHAREVADLAGDLAGELGLGAEAVLRCRLGGWLHDVGKVALPDEILTKADGLSESEWRVLRGHVAEGERIVAKVPGLADASAAVLHHHEHWDGSGYPGGLEGAQIPMEARIVAVANAWSGMRMARPHAPARDAVDALHELRRGAGSQFDPAVVEALCEVLARTGALAAGDPADEAAAA